MVEDEALLTTGEVAYPRDKEKREISSAGGLVDSFGQSPYGPGRLPIIPWQRFPAGHLSALALWRFCLPAVRELPVGQYGRALRGERSFTCEGQ